MELVTLLILYTLAYIATHLYEHRYSSGIFGLFVIIESMDVFLNGLVYGSLTILPADPTDPLNVLFLAIVILGTVLSTLAGLLLQRDSHGSGK